MDQAELAIAIIVVVVILAFILLLFLQNGNKRPSHRPHRPHMGGCRETRYGCCPDGRTTKEDPWGTNCVPKPHPHPRPPIGGCRGTRYGCCADGVTARNKHGTNCPEYFQPKNLKDDNLEKCGQPGQHPCVSLPGDSVEEELPGSYNSVPSLYSLKD